MHGQFWQAEADLCANVTNRDGVRSLTLDIESGLHYWRGKPGAATDFAQRLRAATDKHVSLCMDFRYNKPEALAIHEWLPHVDSLQPMCYWAEFSVGTRPSNNKRDGVGTVVGEARNYALPDMPVVAMLEASPYRSASGAHPVDPVELARAHSVARAAGAYGATLFRYGGEGSSDANCAAIIAGANASGFGRKVDA